MEDLSGLSVALAEDPMQALEQHGGSSGALPASAKRRRVPLAGFVAGSAAVPEADVAPGGFPRIPWLAPFREYVLPLRTTTPAIYVLAPRARFFPAVEMKDATPAGLHSLSACAECASCTHAS